jgi:hypothetical protein
MSAARLAVGMWGWLEEPWTAGFYPEDLPEDWRLAYYANEFSRAYVPSSYWIGPGGRALEPWAAEVPAAFRFVLEWPARWDRQQVSARLAPLLPSIAALVTPAGQGIGEGAVDGLPLTPAEAIWTPQRRCRSMPCGLGLLQIDAPVPAAVLKDWIADLAAQGAPGETLTIIFAGDGHALDAARQARTIAELMGL